MQPLQISSLQDRFARARARGFILGFITWSFFLLLYQRATRGAGVQEIV